MSVLKYNIFEIFQVHLGYHLSLLGIFHDALIVKIFSLDFLRGLEQELSGKWKSPWGALAGGVEFGTVLRISLYDLWEETVAHMVIFEMSLPTNNQNLPTPPLKHYIKIIFIWLLIFNNKYFYYICYMNVDSFPLVFTI